MLIKNTNIVSQNINVDLNFYVAESEKISDTKRVSGVCHFCRNNSEAKKGHCFGHSKRCAKSKIKYRNKYLV